MKQGFADTDMSPPNSDQKHDSNEIRKNHESKTVRVFSNKHQTEIAWSFVLNKLYFGFRAGLHGQITRPPC